ncbi:hypothetical protein Dd1591_0468 [Dickeya chrysanthemi Ech1591]|uniref:Uncharacterized protein n=1 Tax=Dickeya chrysanthemi (strain Ech1591) TaxID=561229 RepID=C6CIX5_DICC1|nr:hypothetical protein [Dickeya chrysanthemi]ACT05354.1 hypothetical protein Dd1591_0468 [Dickeya chrysanthemi Ech1591]
MAFYSSTNAVRLTDHAEQYERLRRVGTKPGSPGIYECQNCGFEDVINRECEKLPPCSNCREESHDWKMIVKAVDADKKPNGPRG